MKKYWIRKAVMGGAGLLAVLGVIWWQNRGRAGDGSLDTAACDKVLREIYQKVVDYVLAEGRMPDGMPAVEGSENFIWLGVSDMTQVEPMVREKPGRHPGHIVCVLMSSGQILYLREP